MRAIAVESLKLHTHAVVLSCGCSNPTPRQSHWLLLRFMRNIMTCAHRLRKTQRASGKCARTVRNFESLRKLCCLPLYLDSSGSSYAVLHFRVMHFQGENQSRKPRRRTINWLFRRDNENRHQDPKEMAQSRRTWRSWCLEPALGHRKPNE